MARQSAAKDLENELDDNQPSPVDPTPDAKDPEAGRHPGIKDGDEVVVRATAGGIQVPSDSSEAPAKPTRKPQAKPFVFDDKNWHLTVNDKHGVFECDLMGMNPHVQMRLAATGLASLLRGRANKQKLLEGIMGGQFGGKRRQSYPATVIAYAAVYGVTVEAAYAEWKQLDNAGKMVIRQSPRIRIALAQMAAERESEQAE